MQFAQPSSGAWLSPAELNGCLLLVVKVHDISPQYDRFKDTDVPTATIDYVNLDGDQELRENVKNAHPGIVNKLGDALRRPGTLVLGRISQVPTDKGNPAWVLGPFVPGPDDARAGEWVTRRQAGQFAQPNGGVPTQTIPAPAPAPQPVTVPAPRAAADDQMFAPPVVPPSPEAAKEVLAGLSDAQRKLLFPNGAPGF